MTALTAHLADDTIARGLELAEQVRAEGAFPFYWEGAEKDPGGEYMTHAANNYPAALAEVKMLRARILELEDIDNDARAWALDRG